MYVLGLHWWTMNQCHVSKVSLHYITCQVNFKPAVIIWPKVVNALVATFLRGDEDLWEVRQGWAEQCWSCLGLQSDWTVQHFTQKLTTCYGTAYGGMWNSQVKFVQGEKNTRLRLIIARVYSWNTQKQEGQSNLMQMKLPRGSYNT